MSSYTWEVGRITPTDGLNPLLPHIAGVIENVNEATFSDIKNEIENDLGQKLSDIELVKALESGIKLGLFNLKREFKVCREFTTKELEKANILENCTDSLRDSSCAKLDKNKKMLIDYVRRERLKRRKKLNEKKKKGKTEYNSENRLKEYLCRRCKKSLEKEMLNSCTQNSDISSEENEATSEKDSVSSLSCDENSSQDSEGLLKKDVNSPEKSKLLVEKNPMETEPYYDIFT